MSKNFMKHSAKVIRNLEISHHQGKHSLEKMLEGKSKIAEWFTGQSIFVTGATGFMGKVMLEKLLYSCGGLKCIYILIREKRGRTPAQRLEDMWQLPMFDRLRKKDPNAIKKIIPIVGDLLTPGFGLQDSDLTLLMKNVSVVFHMAAIVKLNSKLKAAIEQNTAATITILDAARKMKKLKAFCHFSTAYCSADIEVFEERVYECKDNPTEVVEIIRWMDPEALEMVTKKIIEPHPNTYTYSKRLAETLIANEKDNMPVCIIRPALVTPASLEPLPGWVDTINGPMGLLVAAGKGVLRSMHCIATNQAQVVPVDYAINASIVIAYKLGSGERNDEVPVYNLTQAGILPLTMKDVLDKIRIAVHKNPFESQVWFPDGDIRSTKFMHTICCIFMHWLPALLIDFLMFILLQKRFMIRIQKKIHQGLEMLDFFTTRDWKFASDKFIGLWDEMDEIDRVVFPIDFHALPLEAYLENCVLGTRQYCMKEPLSSLPRCRVQQNILYVVHKLFVFTLYYYIFYFLSCWIPPVKVVYDLLWDTLARLPVIS